MVKDVVFINGIVKSMEKRLIGYDKFVQMADASSADEAFKILRECGFGGEGVSLARPNEFETLILNEWQTLLDFFKEYTPSDRFLSFVTANNDFFNAECAVRSLFVAVDRGVYLPEGLVKVDMLIDYVNGKRVEIPEYLKKTMDMALAARSDENEISGAKMSAVFMSGYYEFLLKTAKSKLVRVLVRYDIDVKNISTAVRSATSHSASKFYLKGGAVKTQTLDLIADGKFEKALDALYRTEYFELVELAAEDKKGGRPLTRFERQADDFAMKKLKELRFETEGVIPSLLYFNYKTSEMKNVRIVMAMKLVGADKSAIIERLRECYAG
ncbi:MAG: V-type ATPase subunit [Clostridia bacterium]|nr:V-type ATPase subunit [Clostridia bacterium]